jgi:hypothetical protein
MAEYLCFHMHQAHVGRLCHQMNLPVPALPLDTPEEEMFLLVYDLQRLLGSPDEQVRRMHAARWLQEFSQRVWT